MGLVDTLRVMWCAYISHIHVNDVKVTQYPYNFAVPCRVSMLSHLQVLQDVTAEEFQQFVDVLLQLRTMATRKGAQDLVDIVANQADLSSDFQVRFLVSTNCHKT